MFSQEAAQVGLEMLVVQSWSSVIIMSMGLYICGAVPENCAGDAFSVWTRRTAILPRMTRADKPHKNPRRSSRVFALRITAFTGLCCSSCFSGLSTWNARCISRLRSLFLSGKRARRCIKRTDSRYLCRRPNLEQLGAVEGEAKRYLQLWRVCGLF
jgi:hypothetical protein